MTLAKDFEDFIGLLNKYEVEYLVVGGYALAFHGRPRHTGDLDIWINISEDNANKIVRAVHAFGLASLGFTNEDFLKPGYVTQIGYPPLRIDILNNIDGVNFNEAFVNRQTLDIEGTVIHYIGLFDFIQNKKVTGRPRDLADIIEISKKK